MGSRRSSFSVNINAGLILKVDSLRNSVCIDGSFARSINGQEDAQSDVVDVNVDTPKSRPKSRKGSIFEDSAIEQKINRSNFYNNK